MRPRRSVVQLRPAQRLGVAFGGRCDRRHSPDSNRNLPEHRDLAGRRLVPAELLGIGPRGSARWQALRTAAAPPRRSPPACSSRRSSPPPPRAPPPDCPGCCWRPPACRRPSIPAARSPSPRATTPAPARRPRHRAPAARHAAAGPAAAPGRPARTARSVRPAGLLRPLADDQQFETPEAAASPRSSGDAPCARSAARPRSASAASARAPAAPRRGSAGGRNSVVSTPLRSTVTLSARRSQLDQGVLQRRADGDQRGGVADRPADQPPRHGVARDQRHIGAARGDHHRQPEPAPQPDRRDAVWIEIMGVDRVERISRPSSARTPAAERAIQQPGRQRHADARQHRIARMQNA